MTAPKTRRLAKAISDSGYCSRRDAEKIILSGRVSVDGVAVQTPAFNVIDHDITIDGLPIPSTQQPRLWLYHKPVGLVTTHKDPQNRPTVFQNLPSTMQRVISVGRLDLNSEGLLLLTNSGDLARKLERPENNYQRVYKVRAFGNVDMIRLRNATNGITIDGQYYKPSSIKLIRGHGSKNNTYCHPREGGDPEQNISFSVKKALDSRLRGDDTVTHSNNWFEVILYEGKNREIRKIFEHFGLQVNRLIRTSYGKWELGNLKPGAVIEISL